MHRRKYGPGYWVLSGVLSAQAAFSQSAAEPARIVVLSDSTARVDQGNGPHYGPNQRSNLWPNALLKLVATGKNKRVGGTGLLPVEGNAASYDTDIWTVTEPYRFDQRIGPFQAAIGVGGRIPPNGATASLGPGATASLAKLHGRTLWVYWAACPDSKPFTVTVDGKVRGTFGELSVARCSPQRAKVFSGASTDHTAMIAAPEGRVLLYGAEWSDDDGGWVVDNCAVGGATTEFYNAASKLAYLRLLPKVGLVVVALGINDYAHQISVATYRKNLEGIVHAARAGSPGASVMIVNQYPIFEDGRRNSAGDTQQLYWTVAQQVAQKEGTGYLSLAEVWGSFKSIKGRGYLTSDLVHPSDRGGQEMAAAIAREVQARGLLGAQH